MVVAMSALDDLTRAAELAAGGTASAAHAAIEALPWLIRSIDDDRTHRRFSRWGASSTIDENTGSPVLPQALFDALHERAGLSATWPIGNAGLLHCYGYLLSLAQTPYGLKRERWIGSALARACGLSDEAFLPWTSGPTLLARAEAAADGIRHRATTHRTQTVDGRRAELFLLDASKSTALAYAVAPTPPSEPRLVPLFPVADAAAIEA